MRCLAAGFMPKWPPNEPARLCGATPVSQATNKCLLGACLHYKTRIVDLARLINNNNNAPNQELAS